VIKKKVFNVYGPNGGVKMITHVSGNTYISRDDGLIQVFDNLIITGKHTYGLSRYGNGTAIVYKDDGTTATLFDCGGDWNMF